MFFDTVNKEESWRSYCCFLIFDSFSKLGGEVDEGQPQEDTSDAAITPGEGESYSKYNAQKNKLTLESTHKVIPSPWYKGEFDRTPPLSFDMLQYFEKIFPSVGSLSNSRQALNMVANLENW